MSSPGDEGWDTGDVDAFPTTADNRWRPRLAAILEGDEEDAGIDVAEPKTRKPLEGPTEPGMRGALAGAPSSSGVRERRSAVRLERRSHLQMPRPHRQGPHRPSRSRIGRPRCPRQAIDRLKKAEARHMAHRSPGPVEINHELAVLPGPWTSGFEHVLVQAGVARREADEMMQAARTPFIPRSRVARVWRAPRCPRSAESQAPPLPRDKVELQSDIG